MCQPPPHQSNQELLQHETAAATHSMKWLNCNHSWLVIISAAHWHTSLGRLGSWWLIARLCLACSSFNLFGTTTNRTQPPINNRLRIVLAWNQANLARINLWHTMFMNTLQNVDTKFWFLIKHWIHIMLKCTLLWTPLDIMF